MTSHLPAFESMSLDELFKLYDELTRVLSEKILAHKQALELKLAALQPTPVHERRRRPRHRQLPPKFADPHAPDRTWSGRGRPPRWVTERLAAGLTLADLRIDPLTPQAPEAQDPLKT